MKTDGTYLRSMTQTEYQTWYDACVIDYAKDKQTALEISWKQALRLSTESFETSLVSGLETPNHHLFSLNSNNEQLVGSLWVYINVEWGITKAFIYDITILDNFRRQGFGEQAMRLLEEEARKLGASKIELHVFAANSPAKHLYEKVGYQITDISMSKNIM